MRVSVQNYLRDPAVERLEDRYDGSMALYSRYKSDGRLTRKRNRSRPVFTRIYLHRLYYMSSHKLIERLKAFACTAMFSAGTAPYLRLWSTIRLNAAFSVVKKDFFVARNSPAKGVCCLISARQCFYNAVAFEECDASMKTSCIRIGYNPKNALHIHESTIHRKFCKTAATRILQTLPERELECAHISNNASVPILI
jgi:hypothetical protein